MPLRLGLGPALEASGVAGDERETSRARVEAVPAEHAVDAVRGDRDRAPAILCEKRCLRSSIPCAGVIVDDHDGFRKPASALLEAEGFAVVGEAPDGVGAIAALRPQVVLLDIQLPDLDGFTVAEHLAAGADPPRVVLLSSREAAAYGPRLEGAAAQGFISKRDLSGRVLAALVA